MYNRHLVVTCQQGTDMESSRQMQEWTDQELVQELERETGDVERDIEREAIRRLIEKLNSRAPREVQPL